MPRPRGFDDDGAALSMMRDGDDGVDPMASVANIVDVMLVFACGLMLALVTAYNLDLSFEVSEVEDSDLQEINDIDDLTQDMQADGSGYTELGSVYQDPSTGIMYLVIPSEDGDTSMAVPVEESDGETGTVITGE